MHFWRHFFPLLGAFVFTLGCVNPAPEPEPIEEPRPASPPVPEPEVGPSKDIQAGNEAILERLRQEELARKHHAASKPETTRDATPSTPTSKDEETTRSGMAEMRARAAELEPRMAKIGRIADRIDENYRRYLDACAKSTRLQSRHLMRCNLFITMTPTSLS